MFMHFLNVFQKLHQYQDISNIFTASTFWKLDPPSNNMWDFHSWPARTVRNSNFNFLYIFFTNEFHLVNSLHEHKVVQIKSHPLKFSHENATCYLVKQRFASHLSETAQIKFACLWFFCPPKLFHHNTTHFKVI